MYNHIYNDRNGDGYIKRSCIIYDYDEVYAYRLMSYMKSKTGLPYEIMIYTDVGELARYLCENAIDLLICNELLWQQDGALTNERSSWKISRILNLSEERQEGDLDLGMNHPIFKYQSAENIIRNVFDTGKDYVVGQRADVRGTSEGSEYGGILVVYSPVGKCYKTTLALALADALGKKANVLYINLEEYTGLRDVLGNANGQGGLSDVMYMYRRANAGWLQKLQQSLKKVGHFQVIPPVDFPEDVADILPEEWSTFLRYVKDSLGFDYCVVDVGSLLAKPWELLQIADIIWMPVSGDFMEDAKIEEFESAMLGMGQQASLGKIEKVPIAFDEELHNQRITIEKIEWSLVGRLARKVVSERGL